MQSQIAELLPIKGYKQLKPQQTPGPVPQPKDAALLGALTIIAHDLRGPLANLSVLIELVETYAQIQALDRVKATTEKAQAMIDALEAMLNGFLQRTRETGDPLSYKASLVDLGDVVERAAELNRPVAESRSVSIDSTGAMRCPVIGDQTLLAEAVGNLVGNAVKYAPAGTKVTCGIARVGRHAVISISDEGQGLSELDLKRAFRPFTTLSARYDGRSASWGLGLWIVRLIAERHGGNVEVSTGATSRGACFAIHLPINGP